VEKKRKQPRWQLPKHDFPTGNGKRRNKAGEDGNREKNAGGSKD